MPIAEELEINEAWTPLKTGLTKTITRVLPSQSADQPPTVPQPSVESAPSATEITPTAESASQPSTSTMILLNDLIAVDAALQKDTCRTVDDIAAETGLPPSTVSACIEFLVEHKLAARSASLICGVNAVNNLVSQLKMLK